LSSGSAEVSMSKMSVAIGNKLVLEESNPPGNQIVVGVADNFAPRKFSDQPFVPTQTRLSMFGTPLTWTTKSLSFNFRFMYESVP